VKRLPSASASFPLGGRGRMPCGAILPLAPWSGQRHIHTIDEDHPFTINTELHVREGVRRYEWSICENGKPRDHSTESYATMREARADADKVMEKLMSVWQSSK
jgi:hypothetical protein